MKTKPFISLIFILIIVNSVVFADDGYNLWLNYSPVSEILQKNYREEIKGFSVIGESATLNIVKDELQKGLNSILGSAIPEISGKSQQSLVVAGKAGSSEVLKSKELERDLENAADEGFVIKSLNTVEGKVIVITAKTETGVLYGTFHFLQMLQIGKEIGNLNIVSSPKIKLRILNHWDNLNGSIERGYAGKSLWDWESLPGKIDPRYADYARANASIGINATVLNNVNANPAMLTPEYLEKVAALANVFRPYGLKVFLSVKFSSPVNIGGLDTADPLVPEVQEWWKNKVKEVYSYIPDFGGFLVKANSEGQPGPQNYNRSHAEGANMLADALKPFGGIVMWRAFVYDNNVPDDRAKQALNEFKPLGGKYRDNVLV